MIIRCDMALAIMYLSWFLNIYCVILFTVKCCIFSQQLIIFFSDGTISSSCIFSRECYSLTSPDPVHPDLVGTLGCSVWERWWAHCGQACGLIVGTLVGTLWARWWAHCGHAGGHGTLWARWWAHCGHACGKIVGTLVGTCEHVCRQIVGTLVGTLWARFAVLL